MQGRLFCHISDSAAIGYRQVMPMAFISDRPVLWSPSGRQLQAIASNGDKRAPRLSPSDLASLVESDKVHVIGRDDWLHNGPERQDHKWCHAPWLEGFDDRLRDVLDEDANKPDRSAARVRRVKGEGGKAWVKSETLSEVEAEQRSELRKRVETALGQGEYELPPGIGEKAEREAKKAPPNRSQEVRVDSIMRDLYNHEEALRLSGAAVPFGLDAQWRAFELFRLEMPAAGQPQVMAQRAPEAPDADRVVGLIEAVARIQQPMDIDDFIQTSLSDPELPQLRDALWSLLACDERADSVLRGELERAARGLDWSELIGPSGELFRGVASLLLTILSLRLGGYDVQTDLDMLEASIIGLDMLEASIILLLIGRAVGRRYSLVGAPNVEDSVRALSLCARGTKKPTRADIAAMHDVLRYFNRE